MTLKVGMQHWVLEYYQVCSNDDPWMTLTYFTARSKFVPYAFVWEKGKTMDVSETIVVFDIKVGRCSQLHVCTNLYEYQRSRLFFDLVEVHSVSTFSNFFSLETVHVTWPRWPPCPYMVKTFKNILLWNRQADDLEIRYAASSARALPNLFKWWPWVDLDLF